MKSRNIACFTISKEICGSIDIHLIIRTALTNRIILEKIRLKGIITNLSDITIFVAMYMTFQLRKHKTYWAHYIT